MTPMPTSSRLAMTAALAGGMIALMIGAYVGTAGLALPMHFA